MPRADQGTVPLFVRLSVDEMTAIEAERARRGARTNSEVVQAALDALFRLNPNGLPRIEHPPSRVPRRLMRKFKVAPGTVLHLVHAARSGSWAKQHVVLAALAPILGQSTSL